MATNTPSAASATSTSGQVIARPNLHSSPKLMLANGETAGGGSVFRFGVFLRLRRPGREI